ncbi:hypothetical protein [Rossellomorea vietnamensis]|nr:hypothetical protein [Rossellomorea vietnamensis]
MADNKKIPKGTGKFGALNKENKNDRHNENAKAAANLEQEYPRINTDNI